MWFLLVFSGVAVMTAGSLLALIGAAADIFGRGDER
jgi:hypothetical protein